MKKWQSAILALVLALGLLLPGRLTAAEARFAFTQYPGENFTILFSGDLMLLENLPDADSFRRMVVQVVNTSGTIVQKDLAERGRDGNVPFRLKGLSDGLYYVELYTYIGGNAFTSYVMGDDLPIAVKNGEASLQMPLPLTQNKQIFENRRSDVSALAYYTTASREVQSNDAAIAALAESLTAGLTSDYDKARVLHDWVAENIWYDSDAEMSGIVPPADALTTLRSRKAVCEGYANLYAALLRAAGIPAKTVTGGGLSAGQSGGWTNARMTEENHAWSEVYADGRWLLVDVTWDSGNTIKNNMKDKNDGLYGYRYFDATLEAFSIDHRIAASGEGHIPTGEMPADWAVMTVNTAIGAGIVPRPWQTRFTQAATRAEFSALAAALYEKLAGILPAPNAAFPDTNDIHMLRMGALGVVTGSGNGSANPDGKLTREQAATMLVRLADALGKPLPPADAAFADNTAIASWALDAAGQVQAAGIMGGNTLNEFNPKNAYTREQCIATMLRLFDYCHGN